MLIYEKSCMRFLSSVQMPGLGWAIHWLGTVRLPHLRWQEPVLVTDEGPLQCHSGPGCKVVGLPISDQSWSGAWLLTVLNSAQKTLCWKPRRRWALSLVLSVTSHALALCHQSSAGPVPRSYSGCKNRAWHQSACGKLVRRTGAVATFQDA